MGQNNSINRIPQLEAETKEDKLLLGFIKTEAERIQFGTIVLEFNVKNGTVYHVKSNEISRSFVLG